MDRFEEFKAAAQQTNAKESLQLVALNAWHNMPDKFDSNRVPFWTKDEKHYGKLPSLTIVDEVQSSPENASDGAANEQAEEPDTTTERNPKPRPHQVRPYEVPVKKDEEAGKMIDKGFFTKNSRN